MRHRRPFVMLKPTVDDALGRFAGARGLRAYASVARRLKEPSTEIALRGLFSGSLRPLLRLPHEGRCQLAGNPRPPPRTRASRPLTAAPRALMTWPLRVIHRSAGRPPDDRNRISRPVDAQLSQYTHLPSPIHGPSEDLGQAGWIGGIQSGGSRNLRRGDTRHDSGGVARPASERAPRQRQSSSLPSPFNGVCPGQKWEVSGARSTGRPHLPRYPGRSAPRPSRRHGGCNIRP
jgi:hypothetical protein